MRRAAIVFRATWASVAPQLNGLGGNLKLRRAALLAVFVLLVDGCVYDLDKLKGAQVADAGAVGGGAGGRGGAGGSAGGGTGGGGGGALVMQDAAADLETQDAPPADVQADLAPMIPDRPAGSDVVSTETVGYASLVAYWPLDEGQGDYIYDVTGNGNDGTFILAPSWSAGGAPPITARSKWKLQVDGEKSFVEVIPRTLPAFDQPKSIVFWTRYDYDVDPIRLQTLVAYINRGPGAGVRIEFRLGRLVVTDYNFEEIMSLPAPKLGWHHIAYTFDGSTHTLYLDGGAPMSAGVDAGAEMTGVVTSTKAAEVGPADDKARFRFGRSSTGVPDSFKGFFDDMRVYSRALAADEVRSLSLGGR